ncbi:protein MODIFIER OF SNC1 1 isoform X1 [Ipomoea triloba]|uniref:protein MODIFIER OF SNC1 1 isoform X1 n=1 Tax=Ipomoea triloba TaxID=35885 RepID=UPI00125D46B2|nr:protein MODIFIER OF SNC1 1 isoform X1 [Ipomoea triloba]XP_031118641.1 protein MODIFIER OF SNC1 1 isoform X1 [Ipomoea triloba]XP_031118642.1 protein MODIFIER OF SNC1 1 isoform X1 [Ipomoea triloba]
MTSSMLTGERRWASARRGGMTVLGKVAVPKPLNLPSQRLENHGLDPDVEIVPKGTLSWGSKTSSTTPNAWASSTLSPNADGGTSSPSHLSACPSSGGNGSRPSTAGSDRTHEPSVSAWGSNSRPSSASGALSSSQTSSTSLRPRSAETRPGSSQLSRFAETGTNHPTAWGAGTTAERLGILNSKNEGFSLSSGDFPTLGSEKDNSVKTSEQRGHSSHSRPSSASGKLSQDKGNTDGTNPEQDVKNGAVGMWRRDGPHDSIQAGMDMWQGEPHQYVNADVPTQHFDAWRGPPMHPPNWYNRGPPGGPAYGPPVGPGGFPIEPFPYYRPQIPHLANSQPVPPPGHGPRGHHPRNSDLYRPQIPDTYVRPGMPFRPGFYPGPVAFDGYYGPPMGYCNSSERDIPLMSMPPGPPVYNRYPATNAPDPSNSHARAASRGINNKTLPEQVEPAHPDDARRPYKVLLKQHDDCGRVEDGENSRQTVPANTPHGDRICRSGISSQKNEWEVHSSEEEMLPKRSVMNENSTSHSVDNQRGNSSDNVKFKSVESMDNVRTAPDSWIQRFATTESSPGMAQALPAMQRSSVLPVAGKESTLMKKIEGLNAKVRAHDGHFDQPIGEEKSRPVINVNVKNSVDETGSSTMCFERTHSSGNPVSQPHVSTTDVSRRSYHGLQGRSDHLAKAKFSCRDDGWRKQPLSAECPPSFSYPSIISASNVQTHGSNPQVEAIENIVTSVPGKDEKESVPELFDSVGGQTQRAKMKELAKQRALQLQKEEEERTREQKAKALAKLEELNRRMQGGDSSAQKAEKAPITSSIKEEQGQSPLTESVATGSYSEARSAPLGTKLDGVAEVNGSTPSQGGEGSSIELQRKTAKTADLEPTIAHEPTLTLQQDLNSTATDGRLTHQSNDRHKRTGYKQRQSVAAHKNLNESSAPVVVNEAPKNHVDYPVNDDVSTEVAIHRVGPGGESNTPNNSSTMVEACLQQRRKGSRGSKNKQKIDDMQSTPASLPTMHSNNATAKNTENEVSKTSLQVLDVSSVQAAMNSDNGLQSSEHHSPFSSKEGHGRVSNQWKPQHSRRISRNQHGNRFVDKSHVSDAVVWAPVRSQTKHDTDVLGSQKLVPDSATPVTGDNVVQSNSKSKRAEMERYVPKPVAKELAQQGSGQLPALTSNIHASVDATSGKAESRFESTRSLQPVASTAENVGSVIDSREGEGKTNNSRHGRAWRQRNSTEPQHVKDVHHVSSVPSVHGTSDEKSGRNQSKEPESDSTKSVSMCTSDLNNLDGWGMPIDSAAQPMCLGAKDEGATTGKAKWNSTRDYKSTVNAGPDHKNSKIVETGKVYNQSVVPDIKEIDRMVSAKENRVTGSRALSHWKPKSHVHPVNSQVHVRQQCEKGEVGEAELDLSASENKTVLDLNQGPKRDGKQHSLGGRPISPNQPPVGLDESVPVSAETQNEQRFTSGFRRGGQNNRIGRGQESGGDWSSGYDNQQHNVHVNRERRRSNMLHYEYQPVGQHNNKSSNFGGPAYSSQNVPRYRERGQSRRGGGNFHERKGGHLRGNSSYD